MNRESHMNTWNVARAMETLSSRFDFILMNLNIYPSPVAVRLGSAVLVGEGQGRQVIPEKRKSALEVCHTQRYHRQITVVPGKWQGFLPLISSCCLLCLSPKGPKTEVSEHGRRWNRKYRSRASPTVGFQLWGRNQLGEARSFKWDGSLEFWH